jgi:hypothetical protein
MFFSGQKATVGSPEVQGSLQATSQVLLESTERHSVTL